MALSRNGTRRLSRLGAGVIAAALTAVVLTIAGSASASGGHASTAAPTYSLNVQTYPGTTLSLPLYIAQAQGFFHANHLKVSLVGIPSGPAATQALLTGSVDIMGNGVSNTLLAQAQMKAAGNNDHIVGIIQGENGLHYSLMGRADESWPAEGNTSAVMHALVGKKIGVTALGADTEQVVQGLFKANGLDPNSATYIAVGSGPTAYAAFLNKQVDAIVGWAPTQVILDYYHAAKMLLDFRKGEGSPLFSPISKWTILTYQALESKANARPAAFHDFQKAIVETYNWMLKPSNRAAMQLVFASQVSGIPLPVLKRAVNTYVPLYTYKFNCAILSNEMQFYSQYVGNLTPAEGETCSQYMWSGAKAYILK